MSQQTFTVADLQIGHFVILPVGWKDHPFMFSSFKLKNAEQIAVLKNLGIKQLKVDLAKSDPKLQQAVKKVETTAPETQAPPAQTRMPTKEELQEQASKQSKKSLKQADKAYQENLDKFKACLGRFNLAPEESYHNIKLQVNNMAQEVLENESPRTLHLIQATNSSDDMLYHSLNVSALCLMVANELGWSKEECEILTLAAFMHDIGLLKVPPQIRRKTTPFTKAEQNYYNMHPNYSVELIKKAGCYPEVILPLVASHHERLDGSGYPKKLKENEIDEMSQLLILVNAYDELCSPLPFQKPMSPRSAIAVLFKGAGVKFNKTMLEVLVKVLGIFPPGSLVQLSDERYALVMTTNPKAALKPKVLLYEKGKTQSTGLIINLEEEPVTIKQIVSRDDLPEAVARYFQQNVRNCLFFEPTDTGKPQ